MVYERNIFISHKIKINNLIFCRKSGMFALKINMFIKKDKSVIIQREIVRKDVLV